jgi:hypothetical protein
MASTYLTRTPTSNGSSTTWTYSVWVKRSADLGAYQRILSNGNQEGSGSDDTGIIFLTDDTIRFDIYDDATIGKLETNRKFRDTNAWYHLVFVWNTSSSTSSDRMKIYVNGVRETSFALATYPSQNATDLSTNSTSYAMRIGTRATSQYFNGLLAHAHFIDGTAYDADTFGETDATTGIWKPKTAPSVTYGTNGFFLKFENSGAFGTDSSGNANNFTVNGTMTQTIDTPSNVFATLNPLDNFYSGHGLTNGNTRTSSSTSTNYQSPIFSTLGAASGKYYAECKVIQTSTAYSKIGIGATQITGTNQGFGSLSNQYVYNGETGAITGQSNGATYTDGDIIGIAVDLDNNKLYFSKNGTFQNSGDPTSGATGTGASSITAASSTALGFYFLGCGDIAGDSPQAIWEWNFGNGYFGTTAVSSAENPDDGIGIFEYAVPTGYKALCTKSINAQEYD